MSVDRLSDRVRRELTYLNHPWRDWTIPRYRDSARVLDVLIVGGGQGGLATAFALKREQVPNIRIVDRNPRGFEGPWRRFARMTELRTPKEVFGIDLGIPSLTARAWYEAKFGRRAWERIAAISPKVWQDYLDWYREVLELPVENETEVTSIEPAGDLLLAHLRRRGRTECVHARKIVLATGFEGSGGCRIPRTLVAGLAAERYAHSADDIDFRRLAGKRVGVLGVGASALDNAAAALEAGAARVDICFRRADIPRVNPLGWTSFAGMLGHFAELSDLERWRFMRHIFEELPLPPPQNAFWRCRTFENSRGMPIVHGAQFARRERPQQLKLRLAPSRSISSSLPQVSKPTFRPGQSLPRSLTKLRCGATDSRLQLARRAISSRDSLTLARHSSLWNGSREPLPSSAGCTTSPSERRRV
jgi:FAD-dependent urate hydroxylase